MSKAEEENKKLVNFLVCCLHCRDFVDFAIHTEITPEGKVAKISFSCKKCGLREEAMAT